MIAHVLANRNLNCSIDSRWDGCHLPGQECGKRRRKIRSLKKLLLLLPLLLLLWCSSINSGNHPRKQTSGCGTTMGGGPTTSTQLGKKTYARLFVTFCGKMKKSQVGDRARFPDEKLGRRDGRKVGFGKWGLMWVFLFCFFLLFLFFSCFLSNLTYIISIYDVGIYVNANDIYAMYG